MKQLRHPKPLPSMVTAMIGVAQNSMKNYESLLSNLKNSTILTQMN
jgi:hypothetical protein